MATDVRPRLADLVRNGTMSTGIAATLAAAAREQRSLLFIAIPRQAGKTTTMRAALDYVTTGTPMYQLRRSAPDLGIPAKGSTGYLLMSEIAQTGFDDYLWGDEVRTVFAALERGFSLATALHAPGVDEAFDVICGANGVPDEQAARIDLAVYVEIEGPWQAPERRRISEVREVHAVKRGRPVGRTLFRWRRADDSFEVVEKAAMVGATLKGGVTAFEREFTR